MISLTKVKLAAVMIAAVSLLGATAPLALAQSEAVKSAVNSLESGEESLSPKETLLGVVAVLRLQLGELEKSLTSLRGLTNEQLEEREGFFVFLDEAEEFLVAVELGAETGDVKLLAEELQDWRDEVLNPRAGQIVNFLLVFQTKAVLRVADSRYLKIRSDIERLEDLEIISGPKAQNLLKDSLLLLVSARGSVERAEANYYDSEAQGDKVRKLVGEALNKIKLAYKNFIEISRLVIR